MANALRAPALPALLHFVSPVGGRRRSALLASGAYAAGLLALASAGMVLKPSPGQAFTCDSVTNPAGGNSGASDGGKISATACGNTSTATNAFDSAFGDTAKGAGGGTFRTGATAIGSNAFALGASTTSIGTLSGNVVAVTGVTSIGAEANNSSIAPGLYSTAIGAGVGGAGFPNQTSAPISGGAYSVAIGGGNGVDGFGAVAGGDNSVAIGLNSSSVGFASVAIGFQAQATNTGAFAAGEFAKATAVSSTATGINAQATGL